jgi:hypothetical protein
VHVYIDLKTRSSYLKEHRSLCKNADLANRWAALLANAANPAEPNTIKPIYSDILRQLTPQDARVLDILLVQADTMNYTGEVSPDDTQFFSSEAKKGRAIRYLIGIPSLRSYGRELSEVEDFESIIDNLLRQRLLIEAPQPKGKGISFIAMSNVRPMHNRLFFSSMGYDFMLACAPPTPAIK